jgi:hypothetical protein
MLRRHYVPLALLFVASMASAQDMQQQPPLTVKTIELRYLRPDDAAKLIAPYISLRGGVFEAGSLHAITVRDAAPVVARIDSLLRAHDRAPETVVLRFQLIAALDTATGQPDARIARVDAALRDLFRFKSYVLLAEGSARTEDGNSFTLTMSARIPRYMSADASITPDDPRQVITSQFAVDGMVEGIETTGPERVTRLRVELSDQGPKPTQLLRTGLSVPLGQAVVLGSAASSRSWIPTLILVVQPELAVRR